MPRIIAGAYRGRAIRAPAGTATRPTADRARQALFDALLHAPWGGRAAIEGAEVLDGFAGSGALGLEALSRGAARATFIEQDAAACAAIRANIAALGAGDRAALLVADMLAPPPGRPQGCVFLDPPYGKDLLPPSVAALRRAGWLGPGSLVIAEIGRLDSVPEGESILTNRSYGAARVIVWRER